MPLLSLNFLLYSIGGVWRPIGWSSRLSKLLYRGFTILTIYLLTFLLIIHLLDVIFLVDNVKDFVLASFVLVSITVTFCKAIAAITRRDEIISLIETLQKEPCTACNEEESDIQRKFDRFIRLYSITYIVLSTFSATGAVIGGVISTLASKLPLHTWISLDYIATMLSWFATIQEITAVSIGTIVNIASETLIFGFCLQICAQFEILKYRLQRMANTREVRNVHKDSFDAAPSKMGKLPQHVAHHLCIIRLAEVTNGVFSRVIFVQFFGSILIICLSLSHLSSHTTFMDIATLFVFIICMFVQIFIYCWVGNEVMLQSTGLSEAAYNADWALMTINERKDLLMIMKRSTRPIKFTSSFMVTLSLESYGKLLKASYSAFSILQQS